MGGAEPKQAASCAASAYSCCIPLPFLLARKGTSDTMAMSELSNPAKEDSYTNGDLIHDKPRMATVYHDAAAPATHEDHSLFHWSFNGRGSWRLPQLRAGSRSNVSDGPRFASSLRSMSSRAYHSVLRGMSSRFSEHVTEEVSAEELAAVPYGFIHANRPDMIKAYRQYKAMLEWKERIGARYLLDMWIPQYDVMKRCSPHYSYGVSRQGVRVNYELHGGLEPGRLRSEGITRDDIERHIAFLGEFTSRIYGLHDARTITVMDMKGLSLRKASNPFMLSLSKWYAETIETYYPGNLQKILIVNPPFGATAIVKVMTAVLPASFTAKIEILYDIKDLTKHIDPSQIPQRYGGLNITPLEDSSYEQSLREFQENQRRMHALSLIPEMSREGQVSLAPAISPTMEETKMISQ